MSTEASVLQTIRWRAVESRTRDGAAWLAAGGLAVMVVAAGVVAVGAAGGRSFLVFSGRKPMTDWLAGPFGGLTDPITPVLFGVMVFAMAAGYLTVLAYSRSLRPRLAFAGLGVLHLIVLLAPVLLTADVIGYINYARLDVVHGLNPYTSGASDAPYDLTHFWVIWHYLPSPYGPLFTVLIKPLALVDYRAAVWLVKVAAALAALGCLGLMWRCARLLGRDPVFATVFVGLNPIWLLWAVGGAHNDVLLTLLVLLAIERILSLHQASGGAALAGAVAVKASGGLILPFALLGSPGRVRMVVGAAVGGAAIAGVVLLMLGPGVVLDYPTAVSVQNDLVTQHSVPGRVGELIGVGGATAAVRLAATIAFVVAVLALLVRTWRGADWLESAGWATLALLLATPWFMPWYLVWLLPLAALSPSRRLAGATLAVTAFVALTRIIG
jgi:hypothetical protein